MSSFLAVAGKEVKQRRWAIIGFSLIALLFLALYVSIYPSFQKETAKFDELLKAYPKALLEAFNIEQLQMSKFEGYISAEHFSFVWPLMAILFSLSMAGVAIAGEIERGTMAVLLSLPIGRMRLYFAKYLGGLLAIFIFVLASIVSVWPLAQVADLSISALNLGRVTLLSLCFAWAIFSLGFMVSAMVKEKAKVYFSIGGLLILMYVAKIVSGLIDSMDKFKYASFFYYYSPDKAIVHGDLSSLSIAVFVSVAVMATAIGLLVFVRRDVSV